MILRIGEVQEEDFGTYKCIAKNPRGQTDGQITLTGKLRSFIGNNYDLTFSSTTCFSRFAISNISPINTPEIVELEFLYL